MTLETQQKIGKKLRKIREEQDISQEQLAKAAGISTGYYARLERGKHDPSPSVLAKISKVLKIKSSDILPF